MRRPCGDVHGHGIGAARKDKGCHVHDRGNRQSVKICYTLAVFVYTI